MSHVFTSWNRMMVSGTTPVALPMLHYLCPGHAHREDNKDSIIPPSQLPSTKKSSADAAVQEVEDLTEALINSSRAFPFSIGDKHLQVIKNLQKILTTYLPTIAPTNAPAQRVPSPGIITEPSPRAPMIPPQHPTSVSPRLFQRL